MNEKRMADLENDDLDNVRMEEEEDDIENVVESDYEEAGEEMRDESDAESFHMLKNDGDTKEDDYRICQDLAENKKMAKNLLQRVNNNNKNDKLTSLLEESEKYVDYILRRSRGHQKVNVEAGHGPSHTEGVSNKLTSKHRQKRGDGEKDNEDEREMLDEELNDSQRLLYTRVDSQPSLIVGGTMKPYQIEGLNWLVRLYENGINGILADEMGLGKTLQTISLLAWLRENRQINGPHLIIAPKSTLGNWMKEIDRWCPSIKAFKFHGNKEERQDMIQNHIFPSKYDVIVTSYEMIIRERSILCKRFFWRYVIIDEAHRIKNENSKLSLAVRKLKTQFRLLITGTPLQNNLHELWALLNFLLPEMFHSSLEFDMLFNYMGSDEAASLNLTPEEREERSMSIVLQLHRVIRPFLLRRIKKDVTTELPPKKELLLYIQLTDVQRNLYKMILSKNVDALHDKDGKTRLLNLVMQLRKVCNHPYLFDAVEDKSLDPFGDHLIKNCGKLCLLDRLLSRLSKTESKILIFSQMTKMLDILEDFLVMKSLPYCRIDGNTSGEDRDSQIDDFNSDTTDKRVFLLSTRAGGLGINLATADTVILYDSDWNPQVDLQAMDRAHRIGQKRPVNVYRLIHENTVEEKIIERASMKLQLDSAIIQHGRLNDKKASTLSKHDLINLIQFGADRIFKTSGNSEFSEEDLDVILSRGEEKMNTMNENITRQVRKNLMDFSSDGNIKVYEFEGEDYAKQRKLERQAWAKMGVDAIEEQREQKRLVRIANQSLLQNSQSFAHGGVSKKGHAGLKKNVKLPPMLECQFYNKVRLFQLADVEMEIMKNYKEKNRKSTQMEMQTRALQLKIENLNKKLEKAKSGDTAHPEVAPKTEEEEVKKEEIKVKVEEEEEPEAEELDAAVLEQQIAHYENQILQLEANIKELDMENVPDSLPKDLAEEKAALLASGFADWSRKDFQNFIKGCELYGREDLESIRKEIENKSLEQVKKYSQVFWQRYHEVPGWEKLLQKIEDGEKKLKKNNEFTTEIYLRMNATLHPWHHIALPNNNNNNSSGIGGVVSFNSVNNSISNSGHLLKNKNNITHNNIYTEAQDRYLLNVTAMVGFNKWDKVRTLVRRDPRWRLDWYFRSRTSMELSRRVETLLRQLKKEREKENASNAVAGSGGVAASGDVDADAGRDDVVMVDNQGDSRKRKTRKSATNVLVQQEIANNATVASNKRKKQQMDSQTININ